MQHTALIYTMVLVSASDSNMTDLELHTIGGIAQTLPAFKGFDTEELPQISSNCADMLAGEGGLNKVLDLIAESLSGRLRETAYALACEIAAVDQHLSQEEIRLLELLRHRLQIGRLVAAAIERGVRARYSVG